MAIGWLAVLLSVPWSDVVKNAPKVADGARKLWKAVSMKHPRVLNTTTDAQTTLSPEAQAASALASRVSELETATADLQNRLIASSELIKELADQNTQLIHRVETMRIRVLLLAGTLAVVGMIAVVSIVLTIVR